MAFSRQQKPEKVFSIFEMIPPIRRADDKTTSEHYRLEPLAATGDNAVLHSPTGTISARVEDPDGLGCGSVELQIDRVVSTSETFPFPASGVATEVIARLTSGGRLQGS